MWRQSLRLPTARGETSADGARAIPGHVSRALGFAAAASAPGEQSLRLSQRTWASAPGRPAQPSLGCSLLSTPSTAKFPSLARPGKSPRLINRPRTPARPISVSPPASRRSKPAAASTSTSVRSPTSSPRSPRPNAMARHALTRPSVEIKIQEDFHALGGDTLAMLETYVEGCDVVIHFIGDMAGSAPRANSVDDLLKRRPELAARLGDKGLAREALGALTYTQWEACARRRLRPERRQKEPRHCRASRGRAGRRELQADRRVARVAGRALAPPQGGPSFTSADDLAKQVLASAVLDALIAAGTPPKTKPRNLPLLSLGPLFAERDKALDPT